MGRRPLCLLCLVTIGILYLMQVFALPLTRETEDIKAADELIRTPYTVEVEGEVFRCEIQDDYAVLLLKKASLFHASHTYQLNNVRVTVTGAAGYPVGTLLCARGILKKPAQATNPGQFDQAKWYALQKIGYLMSNPEIEVLSRGRNPFGNLCALIRQHLSDRVRSVFPEDVAGILDAMLVGDKAFLNPEDEALYRMGGAAHMLAISGLHITLLGMGFFRILRRIGMGERPAAILAMAVLAVYAVVTGLSVATLRAVIMFGLVMISKLTGRTYDMPTALAIACLLIVLENPLYLKNAGFLLSFSAVAALSAFGGRSPFAGGVILYVCMLPLVVLFYYEIPLYSVPINLVVVPLLPFVLGGGILGIGLGRPFHWPATLLLRLMNTLLDETARLPAVSLILGRPRLWQILFYILAAAFFLWGISVWRTSRKRFLFYALVPCMVCIFLIRPRGGMKVTFLDVGQGDSCVMELADGTNILVDSGSSTAFKVGTWRTLPFLKYEGIRRVDYLVITHMDNDHISGVREILETVKKHRTALKVGTVVLPYLENPSAAYLELADLAKAAGARVIAVKAGDGFIFGSQNRETRIEVLGPDPALEGEVPDENAQSIVLGVHFGNFDCLLTGDVEGAGEEGVTRRLLEAGGAYDVLKVAHHGSRFSTAEDFLRACRPAVGVISVGYDNGYGHPAPALMDRLRESGVKIFRTDQMGAVTVKTDGESYGVSSYIGQVRDILPDCRQRDRA